MTNQLRILVSGRVQGVFFRASTQKTAKQLVITGIVRNLPDGRVEIIASGATEALEQFISWCQQGPKFARVDHVDTTFIQTPQDYQGFEIR